ncbi:multidrug ABC transporter permease [Corynebacterium pacaense]|uniref:multidrug ABC transporter permease n=1 Tax=Corynebacterium pacaense TaxID=1816684 RepID=UPI0009B9BA11|nr:multidrug ABC transporter permease [Corynebacterium pacaense]
MLTGFFNVLRSEWTKLRTTKSFWWTTGLIVFVSVGFAALTGWTATGDSMATLLLLPDSVVAGLYLIGFLVVIVQSVMMYTTEFRFGYQQQTFLATPRRWVVMVAKWLLYTVISMLIVFLTALLSFYVAKLFASEISSSTLEVWHNDRALAIMWKYPVTAALLVTFSSGVAMLLRQTAGSITLLLMWQLALEDLLAFIPNIGEYVAKYGPFTNLRAFITDYAAADPGWSPAMGGVYFAVWALVLFIAGIVQIQRRDA